MNNLATTLPAHIQAKIAKAVPEIPVAYINMVATMYERERGERPEPPASVRGTLQRIRAGAGDLDVLLGSMPREAQRQFERLAQARGKPDLLAEASHILAMLNGLGRDAADSVNVSRGREPEARRKMVERLVALMRGHGVEPTRNRGGLLHRLAAEIITTESIGEEVGADLDKTIARVLDTIPEN